MLFADDLVLLVSSHQDLQHALDRFSVACDQAGSKTSAKKQGVMSLKKGKAMFASNESKYIAAGR